MKSIIIKGAREHNLRNVSLELPRDKLIVFTGLSGSGKSTLAFDTIYAEGADDEVPEVEDLLTSLCGPISKSRNMAPSCAKRRTVSSYLMKCGGLPAAKGATPARAE